jgi:hypothetical protein
MAVKVPMISPVWLVTIAKLFYSRGQMNEAG